MKTCARCHIEKPLTDFYKSQGAKCKKCSIEVNLLYKQKHSEEMKAYWRAYQAAKSERKKAIKKFKGAFTLLWKEVNKDPVLFTIEAKKLLKKLNALEPKRKIDLWS
jgi:hypothetical protein